jgi:molybdate transport system substrate-binding protein
MKADLKADSKADLKADLKINLKASLRIRLFRFPLIALALFALAAAPQRAAAQERLIVFAAASLKNALDDFNAQFTKTTGIAVTASYAATSALAKQIEAGAPADVFMSADLKWMDYAIAHKLVKPDTRVNLLGNALVLIAPKDSKLDKVTVGKGFDIAKLAGDGRIAVADVKAVPAGRYAMAALTALGVWRQAQPKLAQAENVRAALAFVSRGETAIGIVYGTDAKVDPGVKIVGVFPEDSHPPVTYPVAATVHAKAGAANYLHELRSSAAKAIFEKYGFTVLTRPVS